jgi:hypothetical protein
MENLSNKGETSAKRRRRKSASAPESRELLFFDDFRSNENEKAFERLAAPSN